jgi:hypothetical protein
MASATPEQLMESIPKLMQLPELPKGFNWGKETRIVDGSGFYPLYYTPELEASDDNGKPIVVTCKPELLGYFKKDATKLFSMLNRIA